MVGFASGPIPARCPSTSRCSGRIDRGRVLGEFAKREPKANAAMMAELAQWYGQGKIKPVIDRTMPMAQLPRPTPTWAHAG